MTTIRSKVTELFDKLAAKQPDVIQTGAIRRTERAGGGPSDPDGGVVTTTDYPARMAVFEIGVDRIDGSNILAGDLRVIVEPISIEVTAEDRVICDRGELTIAKLGREASGGTTALYDMLCRGGR